ncbi:hypothetical protein WA556_003941, partial [Blastocystis sp. ATCC 50177/Nand II]
MLERFNRFAPTAVVRAFTQSVSTEVGLPNTTQLLCSYLRDESSVRLLLESGLLDAISSRITNTMSGAVRLSLLRVVYQICSFEVSCNELLQDKDLVASIRGMTLQTDCDNEELKLLSQSVFECLEKGFKNQNIKLEYVNPFSLDFGPVPSYSV